MSSEDLTASTGAGTAAPSPEEPSTGRPCVLCGERKRNYVYVVGGMPIVQCPGCGLIHRAEDNGAGRFAQTSFQVENKPSDTYSFDSRTEREAALQYIRLLKGRMKNGGSILLVAPAGHPFAELARAEALKIGRQLTAQEFENDKNPPETGAFAGAVVLYQLEKARNPFEFLRKLRGVLIEDGPLVLTFRSLNSWPAYVFGSRWPEWSADNYFYFSESTIQSLLIKAGFGRIALRPDRRAYTIEHLQQRAATLPRTILTRLIGLSHRLAGSLARGLHLTFKTSGMMVTAQKAEIRERQCLSIIVPAYEEKSYFEQMMAGLLEKKLDGLDKEIIIIESNSKDGTREAAQRFASDPCVKLILQDRPRGKGHAVREGLQQATGDIIIFQDADLEYDLNDYDALLEPLRDYRSLFVLGARHGGNWKMRQFSGQKELSMMLNFGHVFFTTLMNVLYGQRMKDPFTMYKLFRRECLYNLKLECNRFDFDHELVIKLIRKGYVPLELPVNYRSRSFKEGKKVKIVRDTFNWIWVDLKYRFTSIYEKEE